ncbi:lysophospholipid acyltransferase family protein [Candidatus Pelagibacter communis]|uniref:lysophospholipid acyltransferase family protein n=1 Tax=Pelagibacter ubique TaxID=198252 RepID=UPI00094C203C|nr:lysophospholipid acyltransferase family protein [Candidatus Pelagibacter ubique]|tara:strand:+ start:465 stop:1166 length:702 start_codon:yes stop_codon:yes gene_type:complete
MFRNLLFSCIFFSGIIFISLIFLPSLILPQKFVIVGGKLMGYWASFCLKIILCVKVKVHGIENINTNKKFFIASSHQSMFETFYLQTIFNSPIFVLKKELLYIPIFGWYLKKIGSISINRNKITKDNLSFFDNIKKVLEKTDRPLVIFPQGTRVNPEERTTFKKGVGRIYDELKVSCQPVAINSGHVWPKTGYKKSNKEINISILPLIDYGIEKDKFVDDLQNQIYSELDKFN